MLFFYYRKTRTSVNMHTMSCMTANNFTKAQFQWQVTWRKSPKTQHVPMLDMTTPHRKIQVKYQPYPVRYSRSQQLICSHPLFGALQIFSEADQGETARQLITRAERKRLMRFVRGGGSRFVSNTTRFLPHCLQSC